MPQVMAEAWVPLPPGTAFAVSQTTGEVRLRWDPFIRRQHLLGADRPAAGVRTFTRARVGPAMVSRYVSYRPPTSVGMTMEKGPWFFATFGGGWRFTWKGPAPGFHVVYARWEAAGGEPGVSNPALVIVRIK